MTKTNMALVGRKIRMSWRDRTLIATIQRIDSEYPKTAYTVVWTKLDNPDEDIPPDCGGMCSIIPWSSVLEVLS